MGKTQCSSVHGNRGELHLAWGGELSCKVKVVNGKVWDGRIHTLNNMDRVGTWLRYVPDIMRSFDFEESSNYPGS